MPSWLYAVIVYAIRYVPSPLVRELEIDGDVTLFHTPTNSVVVLNGTASDVWRLLDGQRTAEEIASLLGSVYHAAPATLAEGVDNALQEFSRHGLVEVSC